MNEAWYVIINPAAGKGRSIKKWEVVRREFDQLSIPYVFSRSTHRGHVTELACAALNQGYSRFVSVGGDGTHHEVLNGMLGNPSTLESPVLAIVSAGTGNDLSRVHKIPNDVGHLAHMISAGKLIEHSAGLITYILDGQSKERYFMNVAGMAFDGRVVETLSESFRNIPFLPTYLVAGLRQLMTYRAPEITIRSDGQILHDRFLTVHAGICKYSGGGMCFVPHADPYTSDLAITCIRNMSAVRLLASIYRLYTGTLLTHPKVIGFTSKEIQVLSPTGQQIPIEADGEFLGYTPLTVTIIPRAFRLVVP